MLNSVWEDKEKRNFIRYLLRNPKGLFPIVLFLARVIKRKLLGRLNVTHLYPDEIRRQYRKILKSNFKVSEHEVNNIDVRKPEENESIIESKLNTIDLAYGEYKFDNMPDWSLEFDDYEQTVSLHRWNWLLTKATLTSHQQLAPWGLRLISDWVLRATKDRKSVIWNPYNTGERVSNCILFLHVTHQNSIPDEISKSLKEMTLHVIQNMEYPPYDHIPNHILNNARCIYLSGIYFKNTLIVNFAKSVIRSVVVKIITADGFLNEGSSHYHFLITRWLLEIYHFSKSYDDASFYQELEIQLLKMLKACWFFLVVDLNDMQLSIPLIGDVSPDFPPDWLVDLPWSYHALELYSPEKIPMFTKMHGWSNLFHKEDGKFTMSGEYENFHVNDFSAYPESGWFRLDLGCVTIFWHVEPNGSPSFSSHSHCDTGSFVFYLNKENVIVDPGRYCYMNEKEGKYGMMGSAHNQVLVDGLEPFIYYNATRYPNFYRQSKPECRYEWFENGFKFRISHKGFERIYNDKIYFERTFEVTKNKLKIEDIFTGSDEHRVLSFFHFAPGIKICHDKSFHYKISGLEKTEELTFSINSFQKRISKNGKDSIRKFDVNIASDYFYPSYGRKIDTKTIVVDSKTKFPLHNQYVISW